MPVPVVTVEEFKQFTANHESRRDTAECVTTKTEGKLPAISLNAVAHVDSDLLPDDFLVNFDEQLMYVVHRKDMKEWLESENDWPLPQDCLLSRWWPKVVSEGSLLPLTTDALELSAADHDVKKVTDTASAEKMSTENIFRKEGQLWALCYDG